MRTFQNMRKVAVMASILVILSSCGSTPRQSQNTTYQKPSPKSKTSTKLNFQNVSFNDAVAMAKKEDKPIFIDFYATWCGPCKIMDKQVFNSRPVANMYNKEFVNLKIDVDSREGKALADKYGVEALPTLVIIEPNGKKLVSNKGMMWSQDMTKLGEKALKKYH
ncbi:MAG: thioredoxin family protein [Chitinophagales bacterium]